MRKLYCMILMLILLLILVGCNNNDISTDLSDALSEESVAVIDGAEKSASDSFSESSTETAESNESQPIESEAPENTEKTADSTPPATSETQSKPNLQQETSAPTNNQPAETQQPTNSTPPPVDNTPSPTNPPATTTPTQPEQPTKPTYTDADVQTIINTIIDYGKAQGFILVESYTFEQGHQYYGRPNLQDDGYNGTIEMLKYHIDKIKRDTDVCYFNVVKHIYQGKTEIVVIYD